MQQQPVINRNSRPPEADFLEQQECFAVRAALSADRQQLFFCSTGLEQQHTFSEATTGVVITANAVIATMSAFRECMVPAFYFASKAWQDEILSAIRQAGSCGIRLCGTS